MSGVSFPNYSANPQTYMNSLSDLYTKTFKKRAKFLVNDTFILYAFKIAQKNGLSSYPGARIRLLSKAKDLLQKKTAFDVRVRLAGRVFKREVLVHFIDAHTDFTLAFAKEMSAIQKDSPYIYKTKSYPKTVAFMMNVYKGTFANLDPETKAEWKSQMETSDFAIFERLTDLSIYELLKGSTLLPEFFNPLKSKISDLRTSFNELNGQKKNVLKGKLIGDNVQMDQNTLSVYRDLGAIRASLQESSKVWSTLMHTVKLSLQDH